MSHRYQTSQAYHARVHSQIDFCLDAPRAVLHRSDRRI
jgi:hypothetical protein